MSPSEMVLVCAFGLLGRSAHQLPPIVVLETRPAVVSPNADAFVNHDERIIYLIATAPAFHDARSAAALQHRRPCASLPGIRLVASIIAHEAWHLQHGGGEREAYLAQLTELHRLGLGPGTPAYASVSRAMRAVEQQRDVKLRAQGQPP